jgi:hypothetical protein
VPAWHAGGTTHGKELLLLLQRRTVRSHVLLKLMHRALKLAMHRMSGAHTPAAKAVGIRDSEGYGGSCSGREGVSEGEGVTD